MQLISNMEKKYGYHGIITSAKETYTVGSKRVNVPLYTKFINIIIIILVVVVVVVIVINDKFNLLFVSEALSIVYIQCD